MRVLHIDLETYSDIDIKLGVYRYTDTPDFQILLMAYALDDENTGIIDLAQNEEIPEKIQKAIIDDKIVKIAHNAQFERVCLGKYFNKTLDPKSWRCTMAHATQVGLPASLEKVAKILELEQQKDLAGKTLINYFSKPCKPTKRNGGRTRNYPYHDLEKWELFKKYCTQDVETERAIEAYLNKYTITSTEMHLYRLDQRIADFGIGIDQELVSSVLDYYEEHEDEIKEESNLITGLENANSREQLLSWLQDQGLEIEDIRKETLLDILENQNLDDDVRTVIENRLETGLASVKKYSMMNKASCSDNRVHGVLRYYGAGRTGRWAGRLIQPQNLTKHYLKEIDAVRELVKRRDYETLEVLYDSIADLFKQLARTPLIPHEGYVYAVADYSSIEARVIAWLAGESWAIDVFSKDGDIYKQTAANMFHIPYENIDKPLRQKGKVSVLALGYQGSVGALKAMGALKMGIDEKDLPGLVKAWRKANPHIVKLWKDVEDRAKVVVKRGGKVKLHHDIEFEKVDNFLFIKLPSGRKLAYFKPHIKNDRIHYYGEEIRGFNLNNTYGGKLTENIIQAIARDCLGEALLKIDAAGYNVAFHVHDEVIVEVKKESAEQDLKIIQKLMGSQINWAPDLYLSSAGFITPYYIKD